MDLRQLKYFVAVFEHGNLSRAAEAIPISQPALTRSIKMLEDELGVELFERHARGASPTAAGERFYHHAKSILAECVRARDDALEPVGRLSGDISMGVAPLFVKYGIAEIVAEFCRKHELVSVTAVQGFYEDMVAMLELGQIELAFCNFPVQAVPQSLTFEALFELRIRVFVSSQHRLASLSSLCPKDLSEARWANPNQSHSREVVDSFFLSQDIPAPHIALRTNSLMLIKTAIVNGDFIGLLPEHMMADELESGDVVSLDIPGTPIVRSGGLITRKDGYHRPAVDALADEIRRSCGTIFDRGLGPSVADESVDTTRTTATST